MNNTKSKKSPTVTVSLDMIRLIAGLGPDGRMELEEMLERIENSDEESLEESIPSTICNKTKQSVR